MKRTTLLNFFKAHHSVRSGTLEKRLAAIKESVALTTDRAIIDSSVLMITALAAQLKTTIDAVRQFDLEIEKLCAAHPDFPLFQSLPGAGEVYASHLLVVMGTNRDRWTTAQELGLLIRHRPGDGAQRPERLDPLELLLSQVHAPELSRICG
ncbi:MAG: hypothetical protein ABR568_03825 [Pyrinomonadaceae bacterium]